MEYRAEKDNLGEINIPAGVYWGIHTFRASGNFSVSGCTVNSDLIKAYALVKKACCQANCELGSISKDKADAVIRACDEISRGEMADQFPVDALQGGAGTSTNMNVNEVIANRALELLNEKKGDYSRISPIGDVNLNQSTNDTYPTALKIAAIYKLRALSQAVADLQGAFQVKEKEFADIVAIGRTEMQSAVPITLGSQFGAFAEAFGRDRWRTFKSEERLRSVNIGGTAVGTGLTAPREYIFLVIEKLRAITGLGLARGENVLDQTANADCFVEVSGIMKAHASNLIKVCNDLRLLNMLGEVILPAVQAGSSIMPGKVNPVVLESAVQAGMQIIADDLCVTQCCSRATLQIDEFMPLLAHSFLGSLDIAIRTDQMLLGHIAAIKADDAVCRDNFEKSPMIVTALLPYIGYEKAQELLTEFRSTGKKNIKEFLKDKLGEEFIGKIYSPGNLTALGYKDKTSAK